MHATFAASGPAKAKEQMLVERGFCPGKDGRVRYGLMWVKTAHRGGRFEREQTQDVKTVNLRLCASDCLGTEMQEMTLVA